VRFQIMYTAWSASRNASSPPSSPWLAQQWLDFTRSLRERLPAASPNLRDFEAGSL